MTIKLITKVYVSKEAMYQSVAQMTIKLITKVYVSKEAMYQSVAPNDYKVNNKSICK